MEHSTFAEVKTVLSQLSPARSLLAYAATTILIFLMSASFVVSADNIDRKAVKNALAATVYIEVERVYHGYDFSNAGTGFFIHKDGYVLTNWHVVADQVQTVWHGARREIPLTVVDMRVVVKPGSLDEQTVRGKVIARDRDLDLALLKVNFRSANWVTPNPNVELDILDEVYVIGFPFGELLTFNENGGIAFEGYPEPSLNLGRVTSLRRDKNNKIAAVQTDAAINPGNSGGPLLDHFGRLAGVVFAEISGGSQIGFAIPHSKVLDFYQHQTVKATFIPPYVPNPRAKVSLTIEPGILPLEGIRGSVVVDGPDIEAFRVALEESNGTWQADLVVPRALRSEEDNLSYTALVTIRDTRDRPVFQRKYRLSEVSTAEVGLQSKRDPTAMMRDRRLSNTMSLRDFARKKAIKDSIEEQEAQQPLSIETPREPTPRPTPSSNAVDLNEAMIERAKELYANGDYKGCIGILERLLAITPDHHVAREYLEMAQERQMNTEDNNATGKSTSPVEVIAAPSTGPAEIHLTFDSPFRQGCIKVWIDQDPQPPIEFKFKKRFMKQSGPTRVTEVYEVDSGQHAISVSLEDQDNTSLGLFSFDEVLEPNSRWTLRINLSQADHAPTAYFVEAN